MSRLLWWDTEGGICVECKRRHHPGWGCPKARKRRDKAEAQAEAKKRMDKAKEATWTPPS